MQLGSEGFDAFVGAVGMHPVGQQNHTYRLLQVQPE
jgi:hypothetical protein